MGNIIPNYKAIRKAHRTRSNNVDIYSIMNSVNALSIFLMSLEVSPPCGVARVRPFPFVEGKTMKSNQNLTEQ